MKKLIVMVVLFVSILSIEFASHVYWSKSTFLAREIKRRTGAKELHVLDEAHAADHWYAKVEIDQTGKQFFGRYEWKQSFEKEVALTGRLTSDRPLDCSTCFYRIESDSHEQQYHAYDYTVYVLSSDLKILEVYEQFGS